MCNKTTYGILQVAKAPRASLLERTFSWNASIVEKKFIAKTDYAFQDYPKAFEANCLEENFSTLLLSCIELATIVLAILERLGPINCEFFKQKPVFNK